jgi:NDP-sugar pyrophosphorylase family protein
MDDVEAVILAGGKGTRLRPYTISIPKPLVPLGDEPIIEILLQQLAACGIRRVHIALGHLANFIKAYLEQTGSQRSIEILYSFETKALGTVGPIKQIPLTSNTFLLLNGDVLTTMSFEDLINTHRQRGCVATLAVHTSQVVMDYGIVEVSADGRIVGHREKPSIDVNVGMGVYAFERRVLDHIPSDEKFDIPDLIQALLRAGEPIAAYQSDDYWMDIGRPDDYETAYRDYTSSPQRFIPGGKR